MFGITRQKREKTLSFSEKVARLGQRLREPEWRRYGGTLLFGKVAGVFSVLAIMALVTYLFRPKDRAWVSETKIQLSRTCGNTGSFVFRGA